MNHMTPFSISGILIALASTGFGLFVYFNSSDARFRRLWGLFSVAVSVWGLGVFRIGMSQSVSESALAWKFTYGLGVIWISPIFYHFVSKFVGLQRRRSIWIQYLIGGLFAATVYLNLFFERYVFLFNQFFYVRGGGLYHVFMTWWMGLVVVSHAELFRAYKTAGDAKKKQIQYFFLATAIGYIGGFQTYLPKIGIDVYPWGSFAVPFYPLIMAYAVLKHHLLDIRVFIRRAALLLGIYISLLALVVPIVVYLHHQLSHGAALSQFVFLMDVILVSAALSSGPFLYAAFVRRNEYFQEQTMAGLTHELKSPLSAIESALEILNELNRNAAGSPQQSEYLEMIERNSTRLRKAVEDLLNASPLQNNRLELHLETGDLKILCAEVIQDYSSEAKLKNIPIFLITNGAPTFATFDKSKIRQVVSNLLSNALKFSPHGRVDLTLEHKNSQHLVSIKDSGLGLSSSELPRVFDRFYRGERSQNTKGSGIGLTIAKAWVEAHGGKIWAESEGEGKGTTVRFTVPNTQ